MVSSKRKPRTAENREPTTENQQQPRRAAIIIVLCALTVFIVLLMQHKGGESRGADAYRLDSLSAQDLSPFGERFSTSPARNNKLWQRHARNPVIPASGNGWKSVWTANPDILLVGDTYYMYYRGTGPHNGTQHDRLGVATVDIDDFNGWSWNDYAANPHFDVGEGKSYDCNAILDPAAVYDGGTYFLYYSAINAPDWSIGLAVSHDGFHFKKHGPVLEGRAPEIIKQGDTFYLFYVWHRELAKDRWSYSIYLATSRNGLDFEKQGMVLTRGGDGDWDSQTVTTPRVFREGGYYNMIYAGDDDTWDEPNDFGLAISTDLKRWRKFSGNPIFGAGKKGEWDQGCLWFGTCEKIEGKYYLWYEGSTGGYSQVGMAGLTSQIGLAILD